MRGGNLPRIFVDQDFYAGVLKKIANLRRYQEKFSRETLFHDRQGASFRKQALPAIFLFYPTGVIRRKVKLIRPGTFKSVEVSG